MTALRLILALLLTLPAATVFAQTAPSATELRAGLAGQWTGALGYRDYQSDRLFEIPVTTTIEALPDGVTIIRRSLFDDGPANPVWITSVSLDDPTAGTTTSASYRRGQTPELSTETVQVTAWSDATHWTVVYAEAGEDDDAPADIRVTETRDGDALMSVKDVRPVGTDETAWRFRNQTRLTRVGD